MTPRPADWHPLAEADPVPGDALAVLAAGVSLGAMTVELESQAAKLRSLARAEGWAADAAQEFRTAASDLAEELDRVRGRYEIAGRELKKWSSSLERAQDESLRALRLAQEAQEQATTAASSGAVDVDPDLVAARNVLQQAVEHRDRAAHSAASVIGHTLGHDGLKDSRWAGFAARHPRLVKTM